MIDANILHRLAETIASRRGADAGESYVASLFAKGHDAVLKKKLFLPLQKDSLEL